MTDVTCTHCGWLNKIGDTDEKVCVLCENAIADDTIRKSEIVEIEDEINNNDAEIERLEEHIKESEDEKTEYEERNIYLRDELRRLNRMGVIPDAPGQLRFFVEE